MNTSMNGRGSDEWAKPWTHLTIDRRSPGYCRITFDHPPINTITATTVAELAELVGLIEQDRDLKVVVFDSANPDFYLAHYDVENDPGRTAALGLGPTGCPRGSTSSRAFRARRWSASPRSADVHVAPGASSCSPATYGSPRARTRCSASSRSASASSRAVLRWLGSRASSAAVARSRSSLSPTTSTGRARSSTGTSIGRSPTISSTPRSTRIAARLARFDHEAIARTKSHVDRVTLPDDSELRPATADFRELFARPAQQAQWARLQELGLNTDSDLERSLGRRVVESLADA